MGMQTELREIFSFVYKADLSNDLTEHEFDHVFIGHSDAEPVPDPEEVHDWKYVEQEELMRAFRDHAEVYTPWFKICAERAFSFNSKDKV
jgi:isopentenyl-diphosphate delta-isomerase